MQVISCPKANNFAQLPVITSLHVCLPHVLPLYALFGFSNLTPRTMARPSLRLGTHRVSVIIVQIFPKETSLRNLYQHKLRYRIDQ